MVRLTLRNEQSREGVGERKAQLRGRQEYGPNQETGSEEAQVKELACDRCQAGPENRSAKKRLTHRQTQTEDANILHRADPVDSEI